MVQRQRPCLRMQETQETQVQSLDWEDPLEKEMATSSSILAWRIPGAWRSTVHGVTKSWTRLSGGTCTYITHKACRVYI